MSETNPPKNFTATSIIGNGSFAANAISASTFAKCTCAPSPAAVDWRITHVNGKPVASDTKPYRGTVADALVYGKAENLSEAVEYHRRKLNEAFDNRWHTEVRERYTLAPKWAAWKMAMVACAFSLVVNLAMATYRNEVNPQSIEAIGLGLVIAFSILCTLISLWRKFVPNW